MFADLAKLTTQFYSESDIEGVGPVRLRKISAGELTGLDGKEDSAERMIAVSVCDSEGKPVFENPEQVKAVPAEIYLRLLRAIRGFNRLGEEKKSEVQSNDSLSTSA